MISFRGATTAQTRGTGERGAARQRNGTFVNNGQNSPPLPSGWQPGDLELALRAELEENTCRS